MIIDRIVMKLSSNVHNTDKTTSNGILSWFVEASVEMPPDGLNGECIVHYRGEHSKYEMMVTVVNGKREGEAVILHNGLPILKCSYTSGVVTGNVEVLEQWERLLLIVSRIDKLTMFNSEESLLSCDIESESIHGIVQSSEKYYGIDLCSSINRVVIADMNSKEMIVYTNDERSDISYSKEVIDLDTNGRRWEGRMMDGQPYGYGVVYDEEGRKEYEGFMMDGMRICYGIEYYNDIERVKYSGGYYDNKRFGKGILYDRNGDIEYDDLWKDGEPYSPHFDGRTIDNHTESIAIPDNSFNESKSFILNSCIHSLKRIVIGDECFGSVRVFELNGLSELESVVIGQFSFAIGKDWNTIKTSKRSDGSCRIVNCPKLKSIQIGHWSFSDYHSFELSILPSLQSIDIGERCFYYAPSFSLTGLVD